MTNSAGIIDAMRRAVPPGRSRLDDADVATLRELTAALMAARPEAPDEYARFLAIAGRGLCLPEAELACRLGGTTIVVTGGTGCIGSTLMGQLAARGPARLVSVSRGVTQGWPGQPGAEYRYADITDRQAIDRLLADVRPDIVFHVAAQRSPALAEVEVHRTVSTNVLGTRNVLAAAAAAGVPQVVCASTGKALRPYSPEVYTASKRAAEWASTTAAASGDLLCSAARFTHVIDNSIVHKRLLAWADGDGAAAGDAAGGQAAGGRTAVRLHSAEIAFYVQSALESAQLLLLAMLGAAPGEFRIHAIADLGWPVSLLDVALGMLTARNSATPVYISGYDPGYEEVAFPGLYDPLTAGDVSPLLNSFEATSQVAAPCPMVNSFRLDVAPDAAVPKLLGDLDRVCERTRDAGPVRQALDELSWSLLDATLASADLRTLERSAALISPHEQAMSPVHRRITRAIRLHSGRP
jgi:NAD(P)-dependent dehydrogenase (short-subunit alcohol dehydrogenase family)